jgi:uracil-DNA glycosylase
MQQVKPIFILGEFRTDSDVKLDTCFVSPAGAELLRMLNESGVIRFTPDDRVYLNKYYANSDFTCLEAIWQLHPEIIRSNVFQQHPPRNDLSWFCGPKASTIPGFGQLMNGRPKGSPYWTGNYVRQEFEHELDRLSAEIIASDPNLIICLGNTSLWAMSGRTGVAKLRGTTLLSSHTAADFKLLSTYHPSAIIRQWDNRPTVIADLMKAKRESAYPELRRPPREIWIEPTLEDIKLFISQYVAGCRLLSVDIETSGQRITCIGFATSSEIAIVIPFDDTRKKDGNYWPTREDEAKCWKLVRSILRDGSIPKLFQNGVYDISFLMRSYGILTLGAAEDTMLLSHALQPEGLKGLGYLGSIYSDEGAWKHMRKKDETIKRGA